MKRFVFILCLFFFLLGTTASFEARVPFSLEEVLNDAYSQPMEGKSSRTESDSAISEQPWMDWHGEGAMMKESMGDMTSEEMREMMGVWRMGDVSPSKEVPFYQEKTFLVIVTAFLVLFIVWALKRWGIRPLRVLKKQDSFVNEAILVVDLYESTKLAVTQGDAFAMRITKKMKDCVREVSERFGANFFGNTGDGYLITFPTGTDAVRAAIKILRNADEYNRDASEKERIHLRVGVNYGELVLDEQGGRHGAAINKAFRIEGLNKDQQRMGGELRPEKFPEKDRIFVSEEIMEEIKTAREIHVQEVGVFDLKGLTGLHRIYSVPWKGVSSNLQP